jgi:hypothetical protein
MTTQAIIVTYALAALLGSLLACEDLDFGQFRIPKLNGRIRVVFVVLGVFLFIIALCIPGIKSSNSHPVISPVSVHVPAMKQGPYQPSDAGNFNLSHLQFGPNAHPPEVSVARPEAGVVISELRDLALGGKVESLPQGYVLWVAVEDGTGGYLAASRATISGDSWIASFHDTTASWAADTREISAVILAANHACARWLNSAVSRNQGRSQADCTQIARIDLYAINTQPAGGHPAVDSVHAHPIPQS